MRITTRKLGATAHDGERIRARRDGESVTITYPYDLDTVEAHRRAAEALAGDRPLTVSRITPTGYVFVATEPPTVGGEGGER